VSGATSLQIGGDEVRLRGDVVLYAQHIGFAANLTILDVSLTAALGFVDRRDIPLAASRTLKTRFHAERPSNNLPPEIIFNQEA